MQRVVAELRGLKIALRKLAAEKVWRGGAGQVRGRVGRGGAG